MNIKGMIKTYVCLFLKAFKTWGTEIWRAIIYQLQQYNLVALQSSYGKCFISKLTNKSKSQWSFNINLLKLYYTD